MGEPPPDGEISFASFMRVFTNALASKQREARADVKAGALPKSAYAPQISSPAWVFCMSWCADFEFRGNAQSSTGCPS